MMAERHNRNESLPGNRADADLLGSQAFVGSAILQAADGRVHVYALCWPIVSTGWRSLAQAWDPVRDWRLSLDSNTKHAPSWVAECAPQLGMPFRGSSAEESSIAAILMRTPMSVAVSVLDGDGAQATTASNQRQGLVECLSIYDQYLRVPGRQACSVLVVRGHDGGHDQGYTDAFARSRRSLDVKWLQDMELHVLNAPREPLPLEVAHVVATSIARYRVDEDMDNPIVDTIRAKLSHRPMLLDRPLKKRR